MATNQSKKARRINPGGSHVLAMLATTPGVFRLVKRGKWMNPEHHELANIFPLMTDDEINALAADIRENGLFEKIVLYDGKILDGRNRYMACLRAGVTPEFEQYQGDAPLQYVISLNLHRRHLNESQRAVIAERLANMPLGGATYRSANLPTENNISQAEAAEMLNVSDRTIRTIKAIKETRPELIEQIVAGELTANKAYKLTKPHVAHNSGENEWYTPPEYIEAARLVLGGKIDLDPASSELANKIVQAETFYTKEKSGLDEHWEGAVWMNPPYASDLIKQFCLKFAYHVDCGHIKRGIVLVNNATETAWFRQLITSARAVLFTSERVRFLDPLGNPGAPLQGQALIYFGDNPREFLFEFKRFGWGAILDG